MSTEPEKSHYRACHLCEAICGVEIKTRGDEIVSIKGDPQDPFSRGHICPKATALEDLHNDPDRLRTPVRKTATGWEPVSWEDAFQFAAARIVDLQTEYGNDSIAFYAGNPSVHNYGLLTHQQVLRKAVGSKITFSATSLDQLPHQLVAWGMYGHQFLLPIPDIDRTQYMLIIGGNPLASNGSMMTVPDVKKRLRDIQARGGRLVVIDPRRTETAAMADQHLFIRPGTDVFLLCAMINELLEGDTKSEAWLEGDELATLRAIVSPFTTDIAAQKTGIGAPTIRQLALDLAASSSGVVYGRMGVSTQQFGTLCQWAIQVINLLTGNLDREGGALLTHPAVGYIGKGDRNAGSLGRWHSRVSQLPEFAGELPVAAMAEEILTPGKGQIRGLITIAGNPVLSASNGGLMDRALADLDFMVAIDFYINETTRHADLILPPTGPLEHDHYDIVFHRMAVRNTARFNDVVFPKGDDQRHDWEIFNALGVAIAELKGVSLKTLPAPEHIVDHELQHGLYGQKDGAVRLSVAVLRTYPHGVDLGALRPSLAERMNTATGYVVLIPDFIVQDIERLTLHMNEPQAEGLLLIGRRHVRSNNSWMHNSHRLVKGPPRWHLLMHPQDMHARGIHDGALVNIVSRTGKLQTTVSASEEVMPGVVSLPHGWGHKREGVTLSIASTQDGVSANDLTDERLTDAISGNAVFNGVPVEVSLA
jgi:anaerobic selenocysteine-containing dehydrogenase